MGVYGQPGTPDTIPMDLLFGDARNVKLPLNQKANLKPTLGCTITLTGTGHHSGQDMEDTVLVFMDVRSVKLPQKVNPKLMLGCTTTHMESGHPGGLDTEDTVLVFMDARSVKLLQKVNPMLTLGCTTTLMVYGQLGTPATIPTDLHFGDVRREKPKLSLKLMQKPKLTTS